MVVPPFRSMLRPETERINASELFSLTAGGYSLVRSAECAVGPKEAGQLRASRQGGAAAALLRTMENA